MSFKVNVKVPRITAAQHANLEAEFPGLTVLTGLPVIETQEQAEKAGIELAIQRQNGPTDWSADTDTVEVTSTGWNMVFNVYATKPLSTQ